MSNQVTLQPTEFKDVRTGETSLGFRMYDSYCTTYNNNLESISDDDLEFLKLVFKDHKDEAMEYMFQYLIDNQEEIHIGNQAYPWSKIKSILQPKKKTAKKK